MKNNKLMGLLIALLALSPLSFVDAQVPQTQQPQTGVPSSTQQTAQDPLAQNGLDVVLQRANLNIFESALRISGADTTLSSNGPFTIFAPTDSQLKSLPKGTLSKLFSDPNYAKQTLENHIVQGQLTQQSVGNPNIKTLAGNQITITKNGQDTYVNGQRIVGSARFNNGVIYEIDGTLLPSQ